MRRAPFLPGRDQRHREAALALYRTLIREAHRVPLSDARLSRGTVNPISYIVRKRFASNRSCTSSRLVYAALAAGYQFIDVLAKAQSPSSPEHARLLNYVQSHPVPPSRPRPPTTQLHHPQPPRPGILTKIISSDGAYKYIPTKPPGEDLRWATRRLPSMGRTSEAQTFIRFRKPQPVFLTRKLIKQRAVTVRNVVIAKKVENELMAAAKNEDMWEELLARQMKLEGIGKAPGNSNEVETSYRWSVAISRLWLLWKWERRWYDLVARGDGYQAFLDEVAKVQKAHQDTDAEAGPKDHHLTPAHLVQGSPSSRVRVARTENIYPLMSVVRKLNGQIPSGVEADPFIAPYWSSLVESQNRRLAKMVPSLGLESTSEI